MDIASALAVGVLVSVALPLNADGSALAANDTTACGIPAGSFVLVLRCTPDDHERIFHRKSVRVLRGGRTFKDVTTTVQRLARATRTSSSAFSLAYAGINLTSAAGLTYFRTAHGDGFGIAQIRPSPGDSTNISLVPLANGEAGRRENVFLTSRDLVLVPLTAGGQPHVLLVQPMGTLSTDPVGLGRVQQAFTQDLRAQDLSRMLGIMPEAALPAGTSAP